MLDVMKVRDDFPILNTDVHGHKLIYFDNAASSQKPISVINTVSEVYSKHYSNVHRGIHFLSEKATEMYEQSRKKVADFLGIEKSESFIFTKGATESINIVARSWLSGKLAEKDEVIVTTLDHHSNIVPWHMICKEKGAKLIWLNCGSDGLIKIDELLSLINKRTKFVAISHMSNVLGTVQDVVDIVSAVKKMGVHILIDGAQMVAHSKVDLQKIGCDFYAITGHKIYGPSGIGGLYVHPERSQELSPWMGGGNMIREVSKDAISYADMPFLLEAGTPAIADAIGLGCAIDYIQNLGMDNITAHEKELSEYMEDKLSKLEWLRLYSPKGNSSTIFSFNIPGIHAHDISSIVDRKGGIAVRSGHHCAQPLMDVLEIGACCRASLSFYNTIQEIDNFVSALDFCYNFFHKRSS